MPEKEVAAPLMVDREEELQHVCYLLLDTDWLGKKQYKVQREAMQHNGWREELIIRLHPRPLGSR